MPDALGSVRLVMTSTGSATFSAGYEPYGEEYDVSGTMPAMTYAGAVYDQATGLYLMGARYYSPQLQRFVTADSYSGTVDVPLSLNRYAYVGDDPTGFTDPTGHNWWSELTNAFTTLSETVAVLPMSSFGAPVSESIESAISATANAMAGSLGRGLTPNLSYTTVADTIGNALNPTRCSLTSAIGSILLQVYPKGFNWNDAACLSVLILSVGLSTAILASEIDLPELPGPELPEPFQFGSVGVETGLFDADVHTFEYLNHNPSPSFSETCREWLEGFTFGVFEP